MATSVTPEQLTQLRQEARALAARAAEHERDLQVLLTAAEQDLRNSPADQRSYHADAVRVDRKLCLDAREQQVAIARLAAGLGADRVETTDDSARLAVVLVADDYADSREWLSIVLQGAGFMVRTARNGLEAVIAAHQLQPAVILMDLGMPVLDGVAATRLIKAIDELQGAHVIAYTAQPTEDSGFDRSLFAAVLRKPSPPDHILDVVRRYAQPLV
jgi:CheY-like chemotaxis protein